MYKDVYTYFNYINKTNETNKIDKYHIALISSCSADEVIQKIENNIDFIIENFVYVVTLNNMFQVKMILELNSTQHQYLTTCKWVIPILQQVKVLKLFHKVI